MLTDVRLRVSLELTALKRRLNQVLVALLGRPQLPNGPGLTENRMTTDTLSSRTVSCLTLDHAARGHPNQWEEFGRARPPNGPKVNVRPEVWSEATEASKR